MSRVFLDTLKEIRGGEVIAELGICLQGLVEEVRTTGRAGKLTFVLDVKPVNKGSGHTLLIEDDIKVALPKPTREGTILYATDDNQLSRKDPRQPELQGLREVGRIVPPPERESAQ